jgi:putative transcriptional regulator
MTMAKKYKTTALAAVHEMMESAHNVGAISKQTMRDFDDMCLTPVKPISAIQIKKLREREKVSQTVFARVLNVTPGLISQWERGEKKPSGASLKLLTLVGKKGLMELA